MKKLLTTCAVVLAFSMPAMASTPADFTYSDVTIAGSDWQTFSDSVSSYGNESGADRAVRLAQEMIDLADSGAAYSDRWYKIQSVAKKEGWSNNLMNIVVSAIDAPGSYKSLWQANQGWQNFYDFIDSNGYDELVIPSSDDIADMVEEAWTGLDQSLYTEIEQAFKEGFDQGYKEGYTDGWNDAMNSISDNYPGGN